MQIKQLTLMLSLAVASVAASADVVLITNAKSTVTSVTLDQVSNLYLGKTTQWADGTVVSLADLPESSNVRTEFYGKLGKTSTQVKATWSRIMFTGKGTPPREFNLSNQVKAFVAATPTGVGYVERSAADASVRILSITP